MRNRRTLPGNESGVALVPALMMLLVLAGLVLAFLSVSALEPQVSYDPPDTTRARHLDDLDLPSD
ncbi:MAG TPA: hypothetical protein VGD07_14995 [Methylomirabilota bacterium]